MNIIYALEDLNNIKFPSMMLCGPTPRSNDVKSWRPSFIKALSDFQFTGTVLSPETKDGTWKHNYDNQIDWEQEALEKADLIIFWMPRELKTMPAFTSNIEYGLYLKSGKILYGRPVESVKNSYLDYCYKKFYNKLPYNNIYDLAKNAIKFLDERITPHQDIVKALEALFIREENLQLIEIKNIMRKETIFTEAEVLKGLEKLYGSKFIKYNILKNLWCLDKDQIIKDIIE